MPFQMTIDDVKKDDNDEFDVVIGGDECLVDNNDCSITCKSKSNVMKYLFHFKFMSNI